MLRTLFAIIVLSFFVTPVFATSNKVLPKMYSEEEYEEIQDLYEYGPNVTISSDQNGSPTKLIVSGWGTSTSSALCSVLETLDKFLKADLTGENLNKEDKSISFHDMNITTESSVHSEINEKGNSLKSLKTFHRFVEVKKDNLFLRCRHTSNTTVTRKNNHRKAIKSRSFLIENNVVNDSDSGSAKISVSSLQSDKIKVLHYGIRPPSLYTGSEELFIILVLGISLK